MSGIVSVAWHTDSDTSDIVLSDTRTVIYLTLLVLSDTLTVICLTLLVLFDTRRTVFLL